MYTIEVEPEIAIDHQSLNSDGGRSPLQPTAGSDGRAIQRLLCTQYEGDGMCEIGGDENKSHG